MRLIMTCPTLTGSNQPKPTRSSYFTMFKTADFLIIITFTLTFEQPRAVTCALAQFLSRGFKIFINRVIFHF